MFGNEGIEWNDRSSSMSLYGQLGGIWHCASLTPACSVGSVGSVRFVLTSDLTRIEEVEMEFECATAVSFKTMSDRLSGSGLAFSAGLHRSTGPLVLGPTCQHRHL